MQEVAPANRSPGLDGPGSETDSSFAALKRTARITGLWYLALAICGGLGFLVVRSQIHVANDPSATLTNLVEQGALARLGVVLEMALVVTQAVAAVWFYKLFRSFNGVAAGAIAAFGLMNAVAIMASAVFMASALALAGDPGLAVSGDPAGTVGLMYLLSTNAWGVGALFFGLWLIPMGYATFGSGRMPKWLGRILIAGGFGYILSAFVSHGLTDAPSWLVEGLTIPATIGELWMIGYLLAVGIRRPVAAPREVPRH